VHFRIWPDSIWVHNSIAWDDVHDGQHARNERLRHQNTKLSERLSEVLDEPESVRARWPRQHGARCGALGNEYRTTRDLVPALHEEYWQAAANTGEGSVTNKRSVEMITHRASDVTASCPWRRPFGVA